MTKRHRLLAIYAHPDDEAFSMGGTMARYASQGADVYLVCATRGEAGEIRDLPSVAPPILGTVREQELRAACKVMRVHEPIFLDYRDSGMEGTPENNHPMSLHQARPEDVASKLVDIMRDLQPDGVVTFEPNGGYGHPDHVAINRHTTKAFMAWKNRPARARLYYNATPRSTVRRWFSSAPPDSPFRKLDPEQFGTADEEITTVVDVSEFVDTKLRALACHRSQMGSKGPFSRFPRDEVMRMISKEHFVRIFTPWKGGQLERELFS